MSVDHEFYTVAEVAAIWRVTGTTIRNMCVDGRLSARKFGRQWRIPAAAVLRATDIPTGIEDAVIASDVADPSFDPFALAYQP